MAIISTINNNLINPSNIPSGDILLIGDSYSQGYTPDGTIEGWSSKVKSVVEAISPNTHVYKYDYGGYGFGNGGYTTLITNAGNALDETARLNISTILFGGGYNDWNQTFSTNIASGLANVKAVIADRFPNAKRVIVADFGMGVQGLTSGAHASFSYTTRRAVHDSMCLSAPSYGFACPYDAAFVLCSNDYFSSDYVHPNANGQTQLRNYVLGLLDGTSGYSVRSTQNVKVTNANQNLALTNMGDGTLYVRPATLVYTFSGLGVASAGAYGSTEIDLKSTIPFNAALQPHHIVYATAVNGFVKDSAGYHDINCMLEFKVANGQYALYILPINVTTNGFVNFTNLSEARLQIPAFTIGLW